MAKVRDLVDPETRVLMRAAVNGDVEAEEAARSLLPTRRHDAVGTWPGDRLGELLAARPDLEAEILRRRSEVSQA